MPLFKAGNKKLSINKKQKKEGGAWPFINGASDELSP